MYDNLMKILRRNLVKVLLNFVNNKKKINNHIIFFIFLLLLLCGCRNNIKITEKLPEKNLRIVFSSGDMRWESCMKWVAEKFMEANPDVKVSLYSPEDIEGQGYADRLKALLAQDEFFDVLEIREPSAFENAGVLAPIPSEITDLIEPKWLDENECYTVPRYTTTSGIIYNKDLFNKLEIDEPKSYDDFLMLCERIKENGVAPLVVGGADSWHLSFWGSYLYQNYIVKDNYKIDWNIDKTTEMLNDFYQLIQKQYILKYSNSIKDSQTAEFISSGEAAMLYSGPWMLSQINMLNPEMELGFFFLPGKQGKTYALTDNSVSWGISKKCIDNSEKMELAVRFLSFYYSSDIYEKVLEDMNAQSVIRNNVSTENNQYQQIIQNAYKDNVEENANFIGDSNTPEGFRTFYSNMLRETLWGNKNISDIAYNLVEQWINNTLLE